MDVTEMKPNETKVFVVLDTGDAKKPFDVAKVTYAGFTEDNDGYDSLAFTLDTGELIYIHTDDAPELVAKDANEAGKLMFTLAEHHVNHEAMVAYEMAEAAYSATMADQKAFEKFLNTITHSDLLESMASALGWEPSKEEPKFFGSVGGKRTKIKLLREKLAPAKRDVAHDAAFKLMRKLEKSHGDVVKKTRAQERMSAAEKKREAAKAAKEEKKKGKK